MRVNRYFAVSGDFDCQYSKISRDRLLMISIVLSFCFLIIVFRLFNVVILGEDVKYSSNNVEFEVFSNREEIHDRNGNILAINLLAPSLYADPSKILDLDYTINSLRKLWPEFSKDSLKEKLTSNRRFVWIKRNLTPKEQYTVNSFGIPGLKFQREERRIYPQGNLFSHVLGYVGVDGRGLTGAEKFFNDRLTKGDILKSDNQKGPLKLSLDLRVQNIVHGELSKAVNEFSANGASGIIMDVHSGEVISMISLPDFDPHMPSKYPPKNRFNKATLGVYEMGSTFKAFTMAMALDSKKATMHDNFDVSEPLKVSNYTISDFRTHYDELSFEEIFIYSSNIGSAKIALDVGENKQINFLKKLGFLDQLDIELPERSRPLYPKNWGKVSSLTISYGHGIAVSPLHLTNAMTAMVNGGILHKPTLLYKKEYSTKNASRVISMSTSDKLRRLFRTAVSHGTGKNADVKHYLVGGKTGSADKPNIGGYNTKKIISSFIGSFPMNNPQYIVFVMVDEPVGTKATAGYTTGGMVAAPIVKNIIQRVGPILGVIPVDEEDPLIIEEFNFEDKKDQKVALM